MNITITFELSDDQYKDYEKSLDDFLNNLEEIGIEDVDVFEE